jgi:AcrR family transcriptional regulator
VSRHVDEVRRSDKTHGRTSRLAATRGTDRPRARDGRSDVEQQIFAATEQLLEELSLGELSVGQICHRAGIARGTFYFYFSSKFAVVAALLAAVMDEIYDVMGPFVMRRPQDSPATGLRAGLEAGWRVWSEHRTLMRATCEHWATVPELREMWLGIMARFTDAIAREIESEREAGLVVPGIESRRLAAMLLWSTERCAYVAGLGVDPDLPSEDAILEPIVALWTRAIYGGS